MSYQKLSNVDPEPIGSALFVVSFGLFFTVGGICAALLFTLAIGVNCLANHF